MVHGGLVFRVWAEAVCGSGQGIWRKVRGNNNLQLTDDVKPDEPWCRFRSSIDIAPIAGDVAPVREGQGGATEARVQPGRMGEGMW